MQIVCDTQLTPAGVEVTHKVLGKVATIERCLPGGLERGNKDTPGWEADGETWYVYPYVFAPYVRGSHWCSYEAAEFYALALAHEMFARGFGRG